MPLQRLTIAVSLVLLSPTVASGGPPAPEDIGAKPEPAGGWICYWLCYGACVLTGKSGAQCDAACTDSCFTIVSPPTCGPGTDRACA